MSEREEILREAVDIIAKDYKFTNYNVTVTSITTGGANYTAVLFLVTVSEVDKENLELFVKFNIFSEEFCSELHYRGYELERFTYTELANIYKAIEDEHKLAAEDRFVIPQYYGNPNITKDILVLENLVAKGYTMLDRFASIDWEYACKAVEELAKFHALSIPHRDERSSSFKAAMSRNSGLIYFLESIRNSYPDVVEKAIDATDDKNKERLRKFVEGTDIYEKHVGYYNPLRRRFIIHGDYRVSNLMHKLNEDGSILIVPLDYQTIQMGSPVLDLLYFIYTGSDEAFRREHYERLIDRYYTELCRALSNLDINSDDVYPREDYEYDLKEFSDFGLITCMCFLPLITVETENAPKVGDDPNEILEFVTPKYSSQFLEKWNGVINNYIEWEII
ncbi:uncharacterized protein LOC131842430 [Achroia grisella]|uniref:uncharacterized protein LOC131842430 n=1 Tax=Achroia grisella TaxID=688607 RepID=UPI0027D3469B|nr:uncharacterized protein LOC131842430 [Achroia grisella]